MTDTSALNKARSTDPGLQADCYIFKIQLMQTEDSHKKTIIERIGNFFSRLIRFVSYDIWRITEHEVSGLKEIYINTIKTVILAVRGFQSQELQTKASALTYSTLLAIVPLLAVLVGIAKGFGFQGAVRQQLFVFFPGHELELSKAFEYVESYLAQAQGGIIIGVGLILLFYTVINLISSIEDTFNNIWQIQKARSWTRKIMDYMGLFLLLPILITASSGISIFLSTLRGTFLNQYVFFTPVVEFILNISPFVMTILAFTVLYLLLPNTKVRFINGLLAAVLAGTAFQLFQYLYINGQIWVSKYNAIYGSFAALPLLLLWLQLSWLICLFGAEISYASQNVNKFSFDRDSKHITRRYKDFLTLLIASLIAKRFAKGEKPYTADEISETYRIPIRITTEILYLLNELNIIAETRYGDDDRVVHYQPALDINQLSIGLLFSKIDERGSENFKIDTSELLKKEWEALLKTRADMMKENSSILLKDI